MIYRFEEMTLIPRESADKVHIVCFSAPALYAHSASWILLVHNPHNVRTVNYTGAWSGERRARNMI